MWSDNESPDDYLGFQHLVAAITSIVQNNDLLPATIGVYGDWGSGKSSLIKMVEGELDRDEGIVVLSFNGWLFEGYEDAKTALMGTVLEELLEQQKFLAKAKSETKKQIKRLLKRVNKLRALGGIGKLALALYSGDWQGMALGLGGTVDIVKAGKDALSKAKEVDLEEAKKYLKETDEKEEKESVRRSIREFRKDFAKLLETSKIKTLVIMIDDLDRCDPSTIIETLEAIKLFLFVPRTAFILGADERLVRYAVRKRFPELPGESFEVGRDYLEKLIQFPIRIPPLGRAEMESYINLLFTRLSELGAADKEKARQCVINCEAESLFGVNFNLAIAQKMFKKVPDDLAEDLGLAQRIAPLLATGLNGNPRQCKRFLNTLLLRLEMASSRKLALQQRLLAKLMLLEYFKPEFFKRLAELQGEQRGLPHEIAEMETHVIRRDDKTGSTEPNGDADTTNGGADDEKSTPPPAVEEAALNPEFKVWVSDLWTRNWIGMEPALSQTDLRPYFYFSRDTLSSLGGEIQRMSPAAQEILNNLLHESEAVRNNVLERAKSLSPADAAAVFEALVVRIGQEEDYGKEDSVFLRLFDWVRARAELVSQLLTLLGRLPVKGLPPVTVARLLDLTKGTATEGTARKLLERWSQNSINSRLATVAKSRLSSPS
jgi:KAP-like P-loop domain-containing protein